MPELQVSRRLPLNFHTFSSKHGHVPIPRHLVDKPLAQPIYSQGFGPQMMGMNNTMGNNTLAAGAFHHHSQMTLPRHQQLNTTMHDERGVHYRPQQIGGSQ